MRFSRRFFHGCVLVSVLAGGPFFSANLLFCQASLESFENLSTRADAARDTDRVDEAVSLYRKALELRPGWAEGWWSLGTLQYDSNKYEAAARAFRQLIELAPRQGSAWVMLGLCEFELGDANAALDNLQRGRALGVTNEEHLHDVAVYHIGLLQLRKELYASSLQTFQRLVEDGVQTDEVALGLAMSVLTMLPSAVPAENTRGYAVVLGIGRAEVLATAKKYAEARQAYAALVQQYPDYPGLHFAYGLFLMNRDELDNAVVQLQTELRINPRNVMAMLQIAALRADDNPNEAVEYAKKAIALNPHIPLSRYLLGQYYLKAGNAVAAIPELEQARQGMPNEAKVYFALGNAYARTGHKEKAAQARAEFRRLQAAADTAQRDAPPSGP
jgi:predicted Zn-dependent protease